MYFGTYFGSEEEPAATLKMEVSGSSKKICIALVTS
jgi:hypothetical protein